MLYQLQLSNLAPLCHVPVELLKAEMANAFVLYEMLSHDPKEVDLVLTVSITSVDNAAKSEASV